MTDDIDQDPPREYCETCATMIIMALKREGYTRNVTVSLHQHQPSVRIAAKKRIHGYYVQNTDLRPAYADGIDPVDVAKDAVKNFDEHVTKAEASN